MLIRGEWNIEEALEVRYEEGQEDGIEIGVGKGRKAERNEILGLIKKGYTAADIKKHLRKQTRSVTA